MTFLHVYHHGTMIFNWWLGVKYVAGGQCESFLFFFFFNSTNIELSAAWVHTHTVCTFTSVCLSLKSVNTFCDARPVSVTAALTVA